MNVPASMQLLKSPSSRPRSSAYTVNASSALAKRPAGGGVTPSLAAGGFCCAGGGEKLNPLTPLAITYPAMMPRSPTVAVNHGLPGVWFVSIQRKEKKIGVRKNHTRKPRAAKVTKLQKAVSSILIFRETCDALPSVGGWSHECRSAWSRDPCGRAFPARI